MSASPTIRRALVADAPGVRKLVNHFAGQHLMLARSLSELYDNIRDFLLCEEAGEIVACGAGHTVWEDLAEIKSLAVDKQYQRRGLGTSLVQALENELFDVGIRRVFVLTFMPAFFEKLGYEPNQCPIAEKFFYKQEFNLPIHPRITKKDMDMTIEGMHNAMKKVKERKGKK